MKDIFEAELGKYKEQIAKIRENCSQQERLIRQVIKHGLICSAFSLNNAFLLLLHILHRSQMPMPTVSGPAAFYPRSRPAGTPPWTLS